MYKAQISIMAWLCFCRDADRCGPDAFLYNMSHSLINLY